MTVIKKKAPTTPKKPHGRPSDYTEELAERICDRLATGDSLTTVCKAEDMPAKTAVLRWLAKHESFRTQYAKSKEVATEALAEQYFDILDEVPPMKPDGSIDAAAVTWAKNRADARKWYLSKIAPKKYGDKIQTEHSISPTSLGVLMDELSSEA
jgi:hypothetical protein